MMHGKIETGWAKLCVFALCGLALSGCANSLRFGGPSRATLPGTVVNAQVQIVRDVITDSARRRGSAIALIGDGLVLEAPLQSSREEVQEACGPHRAGRRTRVVLRTQSEGRATLLSEERYIVDGASACFLPLTQEDAMQSRAALRRIKETAEEIQRRVTTLSALR